MSADIHLKESILEKGVAILIEFGYPHVTVDNIMSDTVYKAVFKKMLQENLGESNDLVDNVINELLNEIENGEEID